LPPSPTETGLGRFSHPTPRCSPSRAQPRSARLAGSPDAPPAPGPPWPLWALYWKRFEPPNNDRSA
jgi:hypothetical protein